MPVRRSPHATAARVDAAGVLAAPAPANVRWILTPDHDPELAWLDRLEGLDVLDDGLRRARIDAALGSDS